MEDAPGEMVRAPDRGPGRVARLVGLGASPSAPAATTRRRGSSRRRSRSRGGSGRQARTAATRARAEWPRRSAAGRTLMPTSPPTSIRSAGGTWSTWSGVAPTAASALCPSRQGAALHPRYRRRRRLRPGARRSPRWGVAAWGARSSQGAQPRHQELRAGGARQGQAAPGPLPEGEIPARWRDDQRPTPEWRRRGGLPALLRAPRRPARLPRHRVRPRPQPPPHHPAGGDDPGRLRPGAGPEELAAQDGLRQAEPNQHRDRELPAGPVPVLRRLPAHQLHHSLPDPWRQLRHRVAGDLAHGLAGDRHRRRLRRRRADRDRLLRQERRPPVHRGLRLHAAPWRTRPRRRRPRAARRASS